MGGILAGLEMRGGPWLVLAEAASAGRPELSPPSYGWALGKLLGALLLVCVLAYLVLVLLRRQLQAARGRGPARLQLVDRLPLSSRQSVYLVQAAGRYFLIGAGEGAAPTKLAELESEAVRSAAGESGEAGPRRSFWQILQRGGVPPRPPGEA